MSQVFADNKWFFIDRKGEKVNFYKYKKGGNLLRKFPPFYFFLFLKNDIIKR